MLLNKFRNEYTQWQLFTSVGVRSRLQCLSQTSRMMSQYLLEIVCRGGHQIVLGPTITALTAADGANCKEKKRTNSQTLLYKFSSNLKPVHF